MDTKIMILDGKTKIEIVVKGGIIMGRIYEDRDKIIIQCSGGVINAVYSSDPFLEVEILDYNELEYLEETIEINEEIKKIKRLEKEIESLECVF